jgi:thiosulfate dehydrogenase
MNGIRKNVYLRFAGVVALFCGCVVGCHSNGGDIVSLGNGSGKAQTAESAMPAMAKQGKLIFNDTPKYASRFAGNQLSCGDCHLTSGTADYSAPMIDMAGLFPMFSKRAGHMISLQNRIQECFARSEAGQPPPEDSTEMRALVAYIDWLSRDGVKGKSYEGRGLVKLPALEGNPETGHAIYITQCAPCHGVDGAGVPPVLPALWGKDSYNDGAGMDRPEKMASFVIRNMPQNHPGTLTPQQAFDVAAYIHTMPRPKLNQAYKGY